MNIKLTQEESKALLYELQDVPNYIFNSTYELNVTEAILKIFVTKLMKRTMDLKALIRMELDTPTLRALHFVLSRITPDNPYHFSVINQLLIKIDKACVTL